MLMLVTAVTQNRVPHFRDPTYAREAVEHLYRVQERQPFFLYSFVIMWDHCHVLLHVPAPGSVSHVMRSYKMGLAFNMGRGPLWQPRFHIRCPDDAGAAIRYIHQNPVRKGWVEQPEHYPWSSASGRWDVSPISW